MDNFLCDKEQCTGCAACYNACSQDTISMVQNKEGFLYPVINKEKCISCHQCSRSCGILNSIKSQNEAPTVYAAYSNDANEIKQSSSGGIAFEIFKFFIEHNGMVFSAYMTPDYTVEFKKATTLHDIKDFRGSKYVESRPYYIYREIKKYLDHKIDLVFCGLPCQVAGLLKYLGKNYANLYTIDLVCHGVPSGGVFQDYIRSLEGKQSVKKISFRYKEKDWTPLLRINCKIQYSDGTAEIRDYKNDPYLTGFNSNSLFRESCYQCMYSSIPRVADLTIGDYMGLGIVTPYKKNPKNGISQVLVNSSKGKELFDKIQSNITFEKRDLKECLYFNHNLWKASKKVTARKNIYRDYAEKGYSYIEKNYLANSYKGEIVNRIKELMRTILGDKLVTRLVFLSYKKNGIIKRADSIYEQIEKKD